MEQFTSSQKKDIKVLVKFTEVYCGMKHGDRSVYALESDLAGLFKHGVHLCPDCRALLDYALKKRSNCPLDPKPSCKHCHIHCYSREYRAKISEVMAFSGRRMIMRGRLDYLWHYLF
jgi:Nitrous oxide-stimulated promoter